MAVPEAGLDSSVNPHERGMSPGFGLPAGGSPGVFVSGGAGGDDSSAGGLTALPGGVGGFIFPPAGERSFISSGGRFWELRSLRTDFRANSASSITAASSRLGAMTTASPKAMIKRFNCGIFNLPSSWR